MKYPFCTFTKPLFALTLADKKAAAAQQEYRVVVSRDKENLSRASVETADGQKDETTHKILQILADALK